jgi:hypothetical protein
MTEKAKYYYVLLTGCELSLWLNAVLKKVKEVAAPVFPRSRNNALFLQLVENAFRGAPSQCDNPTSVGHVDARIVR